MAKNWILKLMNVSLLSCSINFLIVCLVICFTGCATAEFKSHNKINISLSENNTHVEEIEFKVDKDFFLLGYFPKHEIFIDDKLTDAGAIDASSLVIENHYEFKNSLWALFTFGVYYPQTYKIKAKFKK